MERKRIGFVELRHRFDSKEEKQKYIGKYPTGIPVRISLHGGGSCTGQLDSEDFEAIYLKPYLVNEPEIDERGELVRQNQRLEKHLPNTIYRHNIADIEVISQKHFDNIARIGNTPKEEIFVPITNPTKQKVFTPAKQSVINKKAIEAYQFQELE